MSSDLGSTARVSERVTPGSSSDGKGSNFDDEEEDDSSSVLHKEPSPLGASLLRLFDAQKYCDAAIPELRIEVHQQGDTLEVAFADNGQGIPDRQRALIFEKFSRLDTARGAPGAGLGLAISREIMGRLGGSLTHEPASPGTRFVVRLPLRAREAA